MNNVNVVPPPPNPFPKTLNTRVLPAGSLLHRIFAARHRASMFNQMTDFPQRFSPIWNQGQPVPTCYFGSSICSAIHESLFHDVPIKRSKRRTLSVGALLQKRYCSWMTQRPLKLATLHAPDLARFETTIDQLIATNAMYYPQTARWAEAIHINHCGIDGLEWPSYRASPELAFVLFGDRVRDADLTPTGPDRGVISDAALLSEVLECGRRIGLRVHATDPANLGLLA